MTTNLIREAVAVGDISATRAAELHARAADLAEFPKLAQIARGYAHAAMRRAFEWYAHARDLRAIADYDAQRRDQGAP